MARELGESQSVEMLRTEILVRDAVTQDVVRGDEQAVTHGDNRAFFPAPGCQAAILRRGIAVFGPGGGPRRLPQDAAQPAVAFASGSGPPLAAGFVVARTQGRPRGGVGRRRKRAHVGTE